MGRATSIANSVTGLTPTVTITQAFNAASLRTECKASIGSTVDFKNTFTYDSLGRLTDVVQQNQSGGNSVTAKRAAFEYNKLDQRTKLTRYQSTGTTNLVATTDYTCDTLNRLSTLMHKQGTTTLAGYTYGYDKIHRPTSIDSVTDGLSTYTYDATSQLTGADHNSQTDESYGFDANGNRNTSGYTTTTNNVTTAAPGFTYTYDDEGNRTSKTETSTGKVSEYTWDYRNRLTVVKEKSSSSGPVVKQVDYTYDAFNRLVKRTYDADGAGSGGATSQYWGYDEGINAVLQFDGSGAANVSHRYLWTDQVDELFADEQIGSDTLYGLGDHLGTLRDIANYNESTTVTSVTNHRKFDSFGKLVSESNSAVDLLYAFTGKQFDEATGLQHNLFRWYDPTLGQWMSEDPLSFNAGDENIRRYVNNRITSRIDPDGKVPVVIPALVFVVIVVHPNVGNPLSGEGEVYYNEQLANEFIENMSLAIDGPKAMIFAGMEGVTGYDLSWVPGLKGMMKWTTFRGQLGALNSSEIDDLAYKFRVGQTDAKNLKKRIKSGEITEAEYKEITNKADTDRYHVHKEQHDKAKVIQSTTGSEQSAKNTLNEVSRTPHDSVANDALKTKIGDEIDIKKAQQEYMRRVNQQNNEYK